MWFSVWSRQACSGFFSAPIPLQSILGRGRFSSVFKAAFLGIPVPLCSCGVLPAAVSLKKQGANSGATTAFLIATPESGVDSIAITYALLGPIMAVIPTGCRLFDGDGGGNR